MNSGNLTSYKTIWSIAWPNSVGNVLFTLLLLVDLYWVARWGGEEPIKAVTLTGPVIWTIQSAALFIFYGMLALISRYYGAGKEGPASAVARQGVFISVISGSVLLLTGLLFSEKIISFYHAEENVQQMAAEYLRIIFSGSVFYYIYMAFYAVFSSHGDTKTPMLISLIAWLVNFVLDPLLILGLAGFPSLGVRGAALATFISYAAAFLCFILFFRKTLFRYIHFDRLRDFLPDRNVIREIIRIGSPAGLNGISRPLSAIIVMGIISMFGVYAVAAFGIAVRIISVNWIYLGGLNIAVSSLTGQNMGAGSPAGAEKAVSRAALAGFTTQIAVSVCLFYFSMEMVSLFTSDPSTSAQASFLLKLFAVGTLFDVFISVYGGALNGAGDTLRSMTASVAANWIYKLPVIYILYHIFSADPWMIYTAIVISIPAEGLLLYWFYRRGGWKKLNIGIKKSKENK